MLFKMFIFKKAPITVVGKKSKSRPMAFNLPDSKAYALEICGDDDFFVGVRDGLSGDALFGISWSDLEEALKKLNVEIDDDGMYFESAEAIALYSDFVAFVEMQILGAH